MLFVSFSLSFLHCFSFLRPSRICRYGFHPTRREFTNRLDIKESRFVRRKYPLELPAIITHTHTHTNTNTRPCPTDRRLGSHRLCDVCRTKEGISVNPGSWNQSQSDLMSVILALWKYLLICLWCSSCVQNCPSAPLDKTFKISVSLCGFPS